MPRAGQYNSRRSATNLIPERQFKKVNNKRVVLAAKSRLHMYHPECAPDNSQEVWATTSHSCCAKCLEPLYKASKEVMS